MPWSGAYITASGNLLADFSLNATAEMQGRLQVARLFNMTDDPGVRDMLRFLVTRDHYHQMQWLAAIEDLKADGLESVPVPDAFPLEEEHEEFARVFLDGSNGEAATEGSWANGEGADGLGPFTSAKLDPNAPAPTLPPGDPRLYGTPPADGQTLLQKAKEALT